MNNLSQLADSITEESKKFSKSIEEQQNEIILNCNKSIASYSRAQAEETKRVIEETQATVRAYAEKEAHKTYRLVGWTNGLTRWLILLIFLLQGALFTMLGIWLGKEGMLATITTNITTLFSVN